jgi:hypothetical protein
MKKSNALRRFTVLISCTVGIGLLVVILVAFGWRNTERKLLAAVQEKNILTAQVASVSAQLKRLQNEDQYVKNKKLEGDIGNIETTYSQTVAAYEDLLGLKDNEADTKKFDEAYADILILLSKREYEKAAADLKTLQSEITAEQRKIASTFTIPSNVTVSNSAPTNGYSRQSITSDIGTNMVDLIAGELSTTKVLVDTASDGTCTKDCPVLSLSDYVS